MSSFVEDLGVRRFLSSFNGLEVNATFDIGCDDDELVNMPTLCTKEIKGGGGECLSCLQELQFVTIGKFK